MARASPSHRRGRPAALDRGGDLPLERLTASRAAGPISPPADTRSTAATISSYQPSTTAGATSSRSSAPRRPDRERSGEVAADLRAAGGRQSVDEPRGLADTRSVNRLRASGRRNAWANGSRWRRCSSPSSDNMLGPTTCAVEKRGSSTVNRPASRMTSMHRSRRVTSQPSSAGTQATGSVSRRWASGP